jgi:hypothetical protein
MGAAELSPELPLHQQQATFPVDWRQRASFPSQHSEYTASAAAMKDDQSDHKVRACAGPASFVAVPCPGFLSMFLPFDFITFL